MKNYLKHLYGTRNVSIVIFLAFEFISLSFAVLECWLRSWSVELLLEYVRAGIIMSVVFILVSSLIAWAIEKQLYKVFKALASHEIADTKLVLEEKYNGWKLILKVKGRVQAQEFVITYAHRNGIVFDNKILKIYFTLRPDQVAELMMDNTLSVKRIKEEVMKLSTNK